MSCFETAHIRAMATNYVCNIIQRWRFKSLLQVATLDLHRRSGTRIIALDLTFMVIPHMCGRLFTYNMELAYAFTFVCEYG